MYCELVEQAGTGDYIFQGRKSQDGTHPLNSMMEELIIKAAGERIGISGATPHWMRHSNASHALDNGCPITLVQASLGHESIDTTMKYVHVKPDAGSSQYIRA